jgi:hypothetical protein
MADALKTSATTGTVTSEGSGTSSNIEVVSKGKGTGIASVEDGTLTATATAGAATLNKQRGTITSEALTTAAGADYTLTLTNSKITASRHVFVSLDNGTNTTAPIYVRLVTPGSGSVVIIVRNAHAASALNGTIKISFIVF